MKTTSKRVASYRINIWMHNSGYVICIRKSTSHRPWLRLEVYGRKDLNRTIRNLSLLLSQASGWALDDAETYRNSSGKLLSNCVWSCPVHLVQGAVRPSKDGALSGKAWSLNTYLRKEVGYAIT